MKQSSFIIFLILFTSMSYGQLVQLGQNIEGEYEYDYLGSSASLNAKGNIMAIGAHGGYPSNYSKEGYVVVYIFAGDNWTQLGDTIKGEFDRNYQGVSVDLNTEGDIIAIGSRSNHNTFNLGYISVYQYNGSDWVQLGEDIEGESTNDHYEYRVSLSSSGNRLAVSSIHGSSDASLSLYPGRVKVYNYNGNSWTQIGSTLEGQDGGEEFGSSICLNADGNTLAIGAMKKNIIGRYTGQVKVYTLENSDWVQVGGSLNGESDYNRFGADLDLNSIGNRIAISSPTFNNGLVYACGKVNIYDFDGDSWNQVGRDLIGEYENDYFGSSVRLNSKGDHLVIGISNYQHNVGLGSIGGVKLYRLNNTDWIQVGEAKGDGLGYSVSINSTGSIISAGGKKYDSKRGIVKVFTNNIKELEPEVKDINIHPNPTVDHVSITNSSKTKISHIKVFNVLGQRMYPIVNEISEGQINLNLSKMSNGVYLITIHFENGKEQQVKVVLSK